MKIKIRSQATDNQGIQFRARLFLVLGVGRFWNIGFAVFLYDTTGLLAGGGWFEIRLGWWRVLVSLPGSGSL